MNILVVDDEQAQRESLAGFLKKLGHTTTTAPSGDGALNILSQKPVDILLSDFRMPGMTGAQLLRRVRDQYPTVVVILITAYGTIETAVDAMKAGAWDFLSKPVDLDLLESKLEDITEYFSQARKTPTSRDLPDSAFIVHDPKTRRLLESAKRVAASQASILITGETGTGKEVLARYLHDHSNRKDRAFVAVNCAALPSNLVESELFGHEKGAFTGATQRRLGRFEEADHGTLFLDEIGDLPQDVQIKLLRFLESGEFQRIGSNKILRSDTRIISATNVDLPTAIGQGSFREDLYFRLNVIHLHMDPLRERPDDILPLARHFLDLIARRESIPAPTLDQNAADALHKYSYPGNIRELRNIMERAALLSPGPAVTADDLDLQSSPSQPSGASLLSDAVADLERDLIAQTLAAANKNQSECARRLGISERVLRYKLQKYSLR